VVNTLELLASYQPLFVQRPAWRYAFLSGGRGSGKSFHVALALLNQTYERGHVILYTRYTMVAANLSIIPEFRDKLERLGREGDFDITASEIVNRLTGSRILFRGIQTSSGNQTARLKSIQGVTTWVLDEAEELVDANTFDTIDLSIRHKTLPNRVILIINPSVKSHFLYERFVQTKRTNTLYIHTTYKENAHNLSTSFLAIAEETRRSNPTRYAHIFGGAWIDEVAGLLWTRGEIVRARVDEAPDLSRVVVAIDPAISNKAESNETGIIVAGVDRSRRGYVLEDLSGKYTPAQWASIAIDAARRWNASIVAEVNQGGDMVESVLRSVGEKSRGIRIQSVKASRGKYARAEPVYCLYQEQRVYHVGEHPLLEAQMVSFNPETDDGSPDRVDALVWALHQLLIKGGVPFVV
jgi:phage terminase large subunit